MTESFFGEIDIDEIPDAIDRDSYKCKLENVTIREIDSEKDIFELNRKFWSMWFVVDDGDFVGERSQVMINLYPGMTRAKFDELKADPSKEAQDIIRGYRQSIKFYKRFAKMLGFSDEEIQMGANFTEKQNQYFWVPMYPNKDGSTGIDTRTAIKPVEDSDLDKIQELEDLDV